MLKITYISPSGKVVMRGEAHGSDAAIVTHEGLGFPSYYAVTGSYYGTPGQVTTAVNVGARVITLGVEFRGKAELTYEKALSAFVNPGELLIEDGLYTKRRISCRASSIAEGERYRNVRRISVQFTCDNPYFRDAEDTVCNIVRRQGYLKTTFTLPAVLSERVYKGSINTKGNVPCEPTVIIRNGADGREGSASDYFLITNHTTGAVITLNYYPSRGETITINISDRSIKSSGGAELVSKISEFTELADFALALGENVIEIESSIENSSLNIDFVYSNLYSYIAR